MPDPTPRYWFRAKRHGWGWRPSTWEGWTFFVLWFAAIFAGAVWMRTTIPARLGLYLAFIGLMLGIMLAVCFAKGEPPRWRWGDRDSPPRT
jgi:hypothetical protein